MYTIFTNSKQEVAVGLIESLVLVKAVPGGHDHVHGLGGMLPTKLQPCLR